VKVRFVIALMSLLLVFSGCATPSQQSKKLYDYYFPKKSAFAEGRYRTWFDEILGKPNLKVRENDALFRAAMQGDTSALRAFLVSADRGMKGEFGQTWNSECVALLVRLGDETFSTVLAEQDGETKAFVAGALKHTIQWRKHPFPKTEVIVRDGR